MTVDKRKMCKAPFTILKFGGDPQSPWQGIWSRRSLLKLDNDFMVLNSTYVPWPSAISSKSTSFLYPTIMLFNAAIRIHSKTNVGASFIFRI